MITNSNFLSTAPSKLFATVNFSAEAETAQLSRIPSQCLRRKERGVPTPGRTASNVDHESFPRRRHFDAVKFTAHMLQVLVLLF